MEEVTQQQPQEVSPCSSGEDPKPSPKVAAMPSTTTLKDVFEALDDLDTPGSTCTGGVAKMLPALPGLKVQGVGTVPLPLTDPTATALKAVAKQAPHGKGMQTIVDKSVRNTLQIDADQVSLENPSWKEGLGELVNQAATALGVNPSLVDARLYKLLLYETGGFFKKHKDTEKEDGMFATLVVQLPSIFTGGSFAVSHNDDSLTFQLDTPSTAPYSCHFVAHYADCEHEILPVESGYRLALIYSLCYTGATTAVPSASNVIQQTGLVSVMRSLDPEHGLFAIPLDHEYTTKSLANLGVAAFKGSDRALAAAFSHSENWKLVIAQMERTDYKTGGISYCGFEEDDCEEGDPEFESLYYADGEDADSEKTWLNSLVDQCASYENDGIILASEDDIGCMWTEGESKEDGGYTGNEGATMETTYSTCVLVAFTDYGVFQRQCQNDFMLALDLVNGDSNRLSHALKYLERNKPTISSDAFVRLEAITQLYHRMDDFYWKNFANMVGCLDTKKPPTTEATQVFVSHVKDFGWNDKTKPIQMLLAKLHIAAKGITSRTFFDSLHALLSVVYASEDVPVEIENLPQAFVDTYRQREGKKPQRFTLSDVADDLIRLSFSHGWKPLRPVMGLFMAKSRNFNATAPWLLGREIDALDRIQRSVFLSNLDEYRVQFIGDFVNLVKSRKYSDWSKSECFVRHLFKCGTPDHFQTLGAWASSAFYAVISKAHPVFEKVEGECLACQNPSAKEAFLKTLSERWSSLTLVDLRKQEEGLKSAIRRGKPVFSWKMPQANTSSVPLNKFLQSDKEGPVTIVVGGGIKNARTLSRGTPDCFLPDGFTANIENTGETGHAASVTVKKTRGWYNAKVADYEANVSELKDVQAKILAFEAESEEPAPKRARTEPEVIIID